jgi:hypothetical protein
LFTYLFLWLSVQLWRSQIEAPREHASKETKIMSQAEKINLYSSIGEWTENGDNVDTFWMFKSLIL